MIEFNYDKIMQPQTVVHCNTQEKANNLLKWADSMGLEWCDGRSYLTKNSWQTHKDETYYRLYGGSFGNINYSGNDIILKYEDVIMEENKNIEDGWYYIKLNQSKEIEEFLPPTRCIYVNNNKAMIHKSLSFNTLFDVSEDMIESPAYVIGKEYEFSDNKKDWVRDIHDGFIGFYFDSGYIYQSRKSVWKYIREIKEPDIEITVKINGNEVRLSEISEETLLKIRQNS